MRRRHRQRGQAATELAISIPVLVLLMLGVTDLARAFYLSVEINGAARAGARAGIAGDTVDIGDFVRSEPNSGIPNTVAAWGNTGPGGVYADCTSAPASQRCGDPNGCVAASFQAGQLACFAVRRCSLSNGDWGTCTFDPLGYGYRPVSSSSTYKALEITVVYRMPILTPLISNLAGAGGYLLLNRTALADEVYF